MSQLVSVILPVYNAEKTVLRAVDSILNQTHNDLELIVVDDGSVDATNKVLNGVSDPRVKLLKQDHSGVAVAANAGFDVAQGAWIARMDADDYSYPARIERQLQSVLQQGWDGAGCQVEMVGSQGRVPETLGRYENWINVETATAAQISALRFVELPLINPTILAKRAYFEIGFRENQLPEDYELFLRAMEQGMILGKVNEVLFDWSDSASRLTRTDSRYSEESFEACRRKYLKRGCLADCQQVDLWGAGKTGKRWHRWLISLGIEVRRLYEISSRKVGQMIHGVKVQSPAEMVPADGTPLLVGVGSKGARQKIEEHIRRFQHVPGIDTWFLA